MWGRGGRGLFICNCVLMFNMEDEMKAKAEKVSKQATYQRLDIVDAHGPNRKDGGKALRSERKKRTSYDVHRARCSTLATAARDLPRTSPVHTFLFSLRSVRIL